MTVEQKIKDEILHFEPNELVVEGQRLDLGNGFFYGNFPVRERLLPKYGGTCLISSRTRSYIALEQRVDGKVEVQILADEADIEALGEVEALKLANSLCEQSAK